MDRNRLEELRDAAGLRRPEVAVLCEVGEAQVRRWESGEVLIPTKHLPTLTEKFGVTVEYLLGWDAHSGEPKSERVATGQLGSEVVS